MFAVLSYLQTGYIWLMPVLLLMNLIVPAKRNEIKNFTGIANTIILFVLGYYVTLWLLEFFIAWYGQNQYEQFAFTPPGLTILSIYTSFALQLILVILLLFKRLRASTWFSIIVWLLSLSSVVTFITGYINRLFRRDYLPSTWSTYYAYGKWIETMLSILLFAAIAALLYWCKKTWHSRKGRVLQK
jgi:hypothetical protein